MIPRKEIKTTSGCTPDSLLAGASASEQCIEKRTRLCTHLDDDDDDDDDDSRPTTC